MKGPSIKMSHLIVSMLWMIMLGNVQAVSALGLYMRTGNLLTVKGIMQRIKPSKTAVTILESPVVNSNQLLKPSSPNVKANSPNMAPLALMNYGNASVQAWKPVFSSVDDSVAELCGKITDEDIAWEKKQCGIMCKKSPAELRSAATAAKSKVCKETQLQLVDNFKEMAVLERMINIGAKDAEVEANKRYKQQQELNNINRARELSRAKGEQYLEGGNIATAKARKKGEFNKEAKERTAALTEINQEIVEKQSKLKGTELNAELNQYGKKVKGYVRGTVGGVVGGAAGGASELITEPIGEFLNTVRTNKGTLISITAAILSFGAMFMPGFGIGMVRRFVTSSVKVISMPVKYFLNFTMSFATWTLRKMMPNRLLQTVNQVTNNQVQNNVATEAPRRPSRWGPPIQAPKPSRWGPPVQEVPFEIGQVVTFGGVNKTFVGLKPDGTPKFSRWSN